MMKDYRKQFPFCIGTTSYIIPFEKDHVVQNVFYLKDFVDSIQLLYFSKEYIEDVASQKIVRRLKDIQKASLVEYSVHLPVDMTLFDLDWSGLLKLIGFLKEIMERSAPLNVEQYVLHIDGKFMAALPAAVQKKRFGQILWALCENMPFERPKLLIENLDYDLTAFREELEEFDMPVCMDIGHLMKHGQDIGLFIEAFGRRVRQIHLHGIEEQKDHTSLSRTKAAALNPAVEFIKAFRGTVILEVYNREDLEDSLEFLKGMVWHDSGGDELRIQKER